MKRLLEIAQNLKPAWIGTAGTGATAYLDGIHTTVGILVGLATLIYLAIRIAKEIRK